MEVGAVAAALCVAMLIRVTFTQQQDSCRYLYTAQPPKMYTCNASIYDELSIGCEVSISLNEEPVSIQWVLQEPFGSDLPTSVLTTADRFTITSTNHTSSVSSVLTIRPLSEDDSGFVYCQAVFQNGSVASPSQRMDVISFPLSAVPCPVLEDTENQRCAMPVGKTSSPAPEFCLYQYTTQPQLLDCNPYEGGQAGIHTECDITFGPTTQEPVGVLWFFVPEKSNTVTRIDNNAVHEKYLIDTFNFTQRIYSSLDIFGIGKSDRGSYYCQIQFQNGFVGEPSQNLTLLAHSAYADKPQCKDQDQVSNLTRCALISGMTPSPEGPTAVVQEGRDYFIFILGGVFGGLGMVVLGVVLLAVGFTRYRMRTARIGYSIQSDAHAPVDEHAPIFSKKDAGGKYL